MEILTVVAAIFSPCIVSNLSVFSIPLSNGKSNHWLNNFLALQCKQYIHRFNSFLKWKISMLLSTIFYLRLQAIYMLFQLFPKMENLTVFLALFWLCIVRNLFVVSILLSNGKSHRCFNAFLPLYCRQSIGRFNSFRKLKI